MINHFKRLTTDITLYSFSENLKSCKKVFSVSKQVFLNFGSNKYYKNQATIFKDIHRHTSPMFASF